MEQGEKRKYGDGDRDPEKDKLAKEVSAQLELERQKVLSSKKTEDDSEILIRKKKEKEEDISHTKNMIAGMHFLHIYMKVTDFKK